MTVYAATDAWNPIYVTSIVVHYMNVENKQQKNERKIVVFVAVEKNKEWKYQDQWW